MSSNFVCNDALDSQIRLLLRARPIFFITGMISDRIDSTQCYYHFTYLLSILGKVMKVMYLLSMAFIFFCPVHADVSADYLNLTEQFQTR